MSGFDTIFRGKKDSTQGNERSAEILKKNTGGKVYQDIHKKRERILFIKTQKNIHKPRKVTAEERVFRLQDVIKKFGDSLKKRQIGIIVLVLFLSFVVYGVGFVLRTERTIKNIIATPEQYYSVEKIRETVYSLWQDYQILGLVADNSPIALEPLTSYGKILRNARLIVAQSEHIKKMTDDILNWKNISEKESIFPLLDTLWDIGENGEVNIRTLVESLFAITPPDQSLREQYTRYRGYLSVFLSHKNIWYDLLGKTHPTKILILNQNNDELRAGGGFPGTVFLIEFENGKIKNSTFHDIYDIDRTVKDDIPAPEGIDRFNSKKTPGKPVEFKIRDANYFPTFAQSALQINAMANTSKIGNIDLVIGINTKLISDILSVTGPIRVRSIPMKLQENNIALVLSMLVEAQEKIHDAPPKGVITTLADTVLDTLIEKKQTFSVIKILWKHIESGEILIASPDQKTQDALNSLNLFDTWKTTKTDFVYPIFTSIGRNKTDRIMRRTFTIKQVNTCKREVILKQKHGWDIAAESQVNKIAHDLDIVEKLPVLLHVQGSSDNVQYLRFVLPKGSLLDTQKKMLFHTIQTSDPETIIDGYVTTKAGGSSTVSFSYTLPKELCGTETQFVKQAGLKNTTVVTEKDGKILSEEVF